MDYSDALGRELGREHIAALNVLRHAKNAFFWLAIVAVALHLTAWIVVRHTDTLDPLEPITIQPDIDDAATPQPATEAQRAAAARWRNVLESGLALGGFVGRASVLVLTGIFLISMLVSLSARLGGAADLARACLWSLVALAMLVPWLRAPQETAIIASAFYAFDDLDRTIVTAGATGGLMPFVRFLLCPILVAVCLVLAQLRFRRAHVRITAAGGTKRPIHEV